MTLPTGFNQWIGYILEDEGPEVNLGPSEPGHASKYGVSVTALSDYNKSLNLPPATVDEVSKLTSDQASVFYAWFLSPLHLDQFSAPIAYRLADIAVNLGISGGGILLQVVLHVWPTTGTVSDWEVHAAKSISPITLVVALGAAWLMKKRQSPNWVPFPGNTRGYGHGWTNRAIAARARALTMIGAAQ